MSRESNGKATRRAVAYSFCDLVHTQSGAINSRLANAILQARRYSIGGMPTVRVNQAKECRARSGRFSGELRHCPRNPGRACREQRAVARRSSASHRARPGADVVALPDRNASMSSTSSSRSRTRTRADLRARVSPSTKRISALSRGSSRTIMSCGSRYQKFCVVRSKAAVSNLHAQRSRFISFADAKATRGDFNWLGRDSFGWRVQARINDVAHSREEHEIGGLTSSADVHPPSRDSAPPAPHRRMVRQFLRGEFSTGHALQQL
jgi:hypothetical protein